MFWRKRNEPVSTLYFDPYEILLMGKTSFLWELVKSTLVTKFWDDEMATHGGTN